MAPKKSSFVYRYFNISPNDPNATCTLCNSAIKCRRDNTSLNTTWMIRHLDRKHGEVDYKPLSNSGQSFKTPIEKNNYMQVAPILSTDDIPCLPFQPPQNEITPPQRVENSSFINTHRGLEIDVGKEHLKLIHPFSLIISGPTSSGKSTLLFNILENLHENITPTIRKVVFIYGAYQEVYKKISKFLFYR